MASMAILVGILKTVNQYKKAEAFVEPEDLQQCSQNWLQK